MERMETNLSIMTKDQLKKFIVELEEENKKLKSDLSECECSMHFENDEVGYRKRECKKLKEENERLREGVDAGQKLVEDLISKNKKLNEKIELLELCIDVD